MKPEAAVKIEDIEFELGEEGSVKKEGGEREIESSGCDIYDSQIISDSLPASRNIQETQSPLRSNCKAENRILF